MTQERLIEIIDIGDGSIFSREKHLAYINMPITYIIEPREKWGRLKLTKEGESLVSNKIRGLRYGYTGYRYIDDKERLSKIIFLEKKIAQLESDLLELNTNN